MKSATWFGILVACIAFDKFDPVMFVASIVHSLHSGAPRDARYAPFAAAGAVASILVLSTRTWSWGHSRLVVLVLTQIVIIMVVQRSGRTLTSNLLSTIGTSGYYDTWVSMCLVLEAAGWILILCCVPITLFFWLAKTVFHLLGPLVVVPLLMLGTYYSATLLLAKNRARLVETLMDI